MEVDIMDKEKIKVGFVITNHQSQKIRPQGRELLQNIIQSIEYSCKFPFSVYIVDNGSEEQLDASGAPPNYHCIIIEDQSIGGLTHAWNVGVEAAYNDNCDLIFNINDDLVINKTINKMVEIIMEHEYNDVSIYGPLTNGDDGMHDKLQTRNPLVAGENITETTKLENGWIDLQGYPLNGFFYAFKRDIVEKFSVDGFLFSQDIRDAWGSQERELFLRAVPKGLRMFIVEPCIIEHAKLRHWKDARTSFNHPKRKG